MKTRGIRISDGEGNILAPTLPDILAEIPNGDLLHWSILYLEAMGHLGEGKSMPLFEKQIDESENGFFIDWDNLNILSEKFIQIIWITLMGCRDEKLLRSYETDKEMYEACDIVIQLKDSSYWKVFSKDETLINKLSVKFKDVKLLEPNLEK